MKTSTKLLTPALIICSAVSADGYISAGEVNAIYFHASHTGVVIKHDNLADPDNCGRSDYFILPNSHASSDKIYSLLLSAQIANKSVSMTVSGCHEGLPAIKHIRLEKS